MIHIKDLEILCQKLPRGYGNILSNSTGFSVALVYKVLKGKRDNKHIIQAAIELAEKHKRVLDAQKNAIKKL